MKAQYEMVYKLINTNTFPKWLMRKGYDFGTIAWIMDTLDKGLEKEKLEEF